MRNAKYTEYTKYIELKVVPQVEQPECLVKYFTPNRGDFTYQ